MDAQPTELKHEIEVTRHRLDDTLAALFERVQRASPLYVLRHHPLATLAVGCGIAMGVIGAWRLDAYVSRRRRRRGPIVVQLSRRGS